MKSTASQKSPPLDQFNHAVPRAPRSASQIRRISIRNKRQIYLDQHPEYFLNKEHEFADPILYDKLVRQFLSASEREAEGKVKGYARILEGDLLRSEAKLEQLSAGMDALSCSRCSPTRSFWSIELLETNEAPQSKDEALEMWTSFLRDRFMNGGDTDFDYTTIDEDEGLDIQAQRDAEDEWFDDEEPSFVSISDDDNDSSGSKKERHLRGETGIQDF